MNPTDETYQSLNKAYNFFNEEFFKGKLPTCLITMQRKSKARGYFCPERFEARGSNLFKVHEIALNPSLFKDRTDIDILSTLLHEMVHLWQQENGQPSRRNYHNREWAAKMEEVGLIPSNTESEGGRRTGQSMSHYVQIGGKFDLLIKKYLKENKPTLYEDRPVLKATRVNKKSKIKYSCPHCSLNAWGKPGIKIMCGEDKQLLVAEE